MKDYKHAVYIGRFQPLHDGHLAVIRKGLEIAENVIIVVGSINAAPSIKNPWSFEERKMMILKSLAAPEFLNHTGTVKVVGVRDYHYNENAWVAEVQSKTDEFISPGDSVALLGEWKDGSSYYLKHFPQWDFHTTGFTDRIDATDIREMIFKQSYGKDWEGKVPEAHRLDLWEVVKRLPVPDPVAREISEWALTPAYPELCTEFKFIEGYKAQWAQSPYPPTFTTVDACVVCSGHVLVVERKINPGKGLKALPGGFLKVDEKTQVGALRELREETAIRLEQPILESSIVASKVFDHPSRSLRGRTISHGFYLKLRDGKLPEVSGGDDAAKAYWMPLADVFKNERGFFDDHAHIITYFVGLQGGV